MPEPAAPDAEALAVAHLSAHVRIRALAAPLDPDDPESPANVGTDRVGPYPMVQIVRTPLNARAGADGPMWLDGPELAVYAWGAPPGAVVAAGRAHDKPALFALVHAAVMALAEMPDREDYADGEPVVTDVRLSYGPGWAPDNDAQQEGYAAGVVLHLHPPRS